MDDWGNAVTWGTVILFTLFMPVTAVSFFSFRLKKKESEFGEILNKLNLQKKDVLFLVPAVEDEFSRWDYVIPVLFVTVICFLGSYLVMFGSEEGFARVHGFILGGSLVPGDGEAMDKNRIFLYQQKSLAIGVWAFMGAFIWSMQSILRRLITIDVPPGVYYGIGVRMIFASFLALAIYHLLANAYDLVVPGNEVGTGGENPNLWPALGFVIGMFPQRWLLFLVENIEKIYRRTPLRRDALPLQMIEGITSHHQVRLNEIGIDNSQNLAKSHFIELLLRTPFKSYQIIDWMSVAFLHIYFHDDLKKVQGAGIRDIFALRKLGSSEQDIAQLSQATGIDASKIAFVCKSVDDDPAVDELISARKAFSVL